VTVVESSIYFGPMSENDHCLLISPNRQNANTEVRGKKTGKLFEEIERKKEGSKQRRKGRKHVGVCYK
jgi:hypothetical protein